MEVNGSLVLHPRPNQSNGSCNSPLPPRTEQELLQRAEALAGLTVAACSQRLGVTVPANLLHNKGWVGQLLEQLLGASANSRQEPDFTEIGVELKTLPITHEGLPLESTYICNVPLDEIIPTPWEKSWIRTKLQRVLWVPVIAEREIPLPQRKIASPLLWSPSEEEERVLQRDWSELMDRIWSGEVETISARMGEVLQIRPKAAHSRIRTSAFNPQGEVIEVNPRGFYLRPGFTRYLLQHYFF
ncbi:MAG: DNA mismatch repair endonuclease MutH [Gammaproteobacteria bacterium]|nr:DNA mismatch repair endonuclease MutH [Gammaproteobacteria bacterium]